MINNINPIWIDSKVYNIFFLVFYFLLTFSNSAFPEIVSIEGVEPLSGKTIASARANALSNALKAAVENTAKEIYPNIDAKSLEKLINENPIRYIKAYRILDENRVEDNYKITVEANVDSDGLRKKLMVFMVTKVKSLGKPSISIIVLQIPESDPTIQTLPLSDVKREITRVLQGGGYKVEESMEDIRLETYVSIKTSEGGKIDGSRFYALGSVLIKAKDKNGKVLSEVSDSSYLNGADLAQLSLDAIKQAGAKAAEKLKLEFDKKWDIGPRSKSRAIEITFVGFNNYKQYELIDTLLANSTPGIDAITKRIFRTGRISFLVLSSVNHDQLAKTVGNHTTPGFSLRLNTSSSDRIEYSVVTIAE